MIHVTVSINDSAIRYWLPPVADESIKSDDDDDSTEFFG